VIYIVFSQVVFRHCYSKSYGRKVAERRLELRRGEMPRHLLASINGSVNGENWMRPALGGQNCTPKHTYAETKNPAHPAYSWVRDQHLVTRSRKSRAKP
jgi:hypothetical protein